MTDTGVRGWTSALLEDLLEPGGMFDGPFGSNLKTSDYTEHGVRVVRLENLANLRFVHDRETYISHEKYQQLQKHAIVEGDVIFGSFIDGATRVCLLPRLTTPAIAKADCFTIRPRRDLVDRAFLVYQLGTEEARRKLEVHTHGATRPRVNTRQLRSYEVVFPPLNEQKRIVAKIEELTARSRRAKEALDAVPPLLDKLRQSILAAAFRGDLTADWRAKNPDVEPASVLLARMRAMRSARTSGKRAHRLPEGLESAEKAGLPILPPTWCWATAAEVVHEDTIVTYGVVQPGPHIEDGVPYVRGQDIVNGTVLREQLRRMSSDLAATKPHSVLAEGDVLLCIIRHLRVGIVPPGMDGANITQGAVRLRPSFMMTGRYLAEYLAAPFAQQWMLDKHFGLAMPRINVADARRVPIAVPPVAEQIAISEALAKYLAPAGVISEVVDANMAGLQTLEQSILAKAFRGELVPQDPTDEPASVLLERIRAAHEAAPPRKSRRTHKPKASAEAPTRPRPITSKPKPPAQLTFDLTAAAIQSEVAPALWLRGPLDKDTAVRTLAEHLRSKQLVEFKRLRADGQLYAQLLAAIEAAVKAGDLDRPRRGHVRACKPKPSDYTRDDWRAVLLASLGPEPIHQEDAVRQAAEWAREQLGLEFKRLRTDGLIAKGLRSAIKSGVRRGQIKRDGKRIQVIA